MKTESQHHNFLGFPSKTLTCRSGAVFRFAMGEPDTSSKIPIRQCNHNHQSTMKRDRWDSSSDEDGDGGGAARAVAAVAAAAKKKKKNKDKKDKMTYHDKKRPKQQNEAKGDKTVVAQTGRFPPHNPLLKGCRLVYDSYDRLDRLDEGTYGVVWKAKDLGTQTESWRIACWIWDSNVPVLIIWIPRSISLSSFCRSR